MNAKRLFEWQVVFWALFIVAFASAGAWMFRRLPAHPVVRGQGPANSTDTAFYNDLKLEDGVQTVTGCVANLPPRSKVAVVFRHGTYQTLAAQLTCLTVWQHGHVPFEVSADPRDARNQLSQLGPVFVCWLDGPPPDWLPELKVKSAGFACGPYRILEP